jgi:ferrous iron transport protein A
VPPLRRSAHEGHDLKSAMALFVWREFVYNKNNSHLAESMSAKKMSTPAAAPLIGLHQLARQTPAVVVGMNPTQDDEERGIALRLLEIGFLPGEVVRVIAQGFPGHDPLAVRVGHTTFALRSHEAALVQVRPA